MFDIKLAIQTLALGFVLNAPCGLSAQDRYDDTGWKSAGRSGIPNANEALPNWPPKTIAPIEAAATNPDSNTWKEVKLSRTSAVSQAAQNCVRLWFGDNGGSGVYLGEKIIQTCFHVPEGTSGRGVAIFQDGTRINVRVHSQDTTWDLAALEMDQEHPTLSGVEIAQTNPRDGQTVYSAGFGGTGMLRIFGGPVVAGNWGMPSHVRVSSTDWFDHVNSSVSGDSGGPVFTTEGKVCGTLWGGNGRNTTASCTGRISLFLKPLFPRLAAWRARRIAGQIQGIAIKNCPTCPQGGCTTESQCGMPPSMGMSGGGRMVQQPGWGAPTPVQPTTPEPVQPVIDYEKIASALLPKLAQDPRFKGKDGEDGKDGKDGEDGRDGKEGAQGPVGPTGQVTPAQLAAMSAALLEQMAKDDRFKGPPGEITPEQISELTEQIKKGLNRQVLLVDGQEEKVLSDQTYEFDKPFVFDINKLYRHASVN